MKKIAVTLAFLLMLSGCLMPGSGGQGVVEGGRYVHDSYGFSMEFPRGWTVNHEPENPEALVSFIPPETTEIVFEVGVKDIPFSENVEVADVDLIEMGEDIIDNVNGNKLSGGFITLDGNVTAYEIVVGVSESSLTTTLKMKYVYFSKNGRVYILAYGGALDKFDKHVKDFDESLKTIKLR